MVFRRALALSNSDAGLRCQLASVQIMAAAFQEDAIATLQPLLHGKTLPILMSSL